MYCDPHTRMYDGLNTLCSMITKKSQLADQKKKKVSEPPQKKKKEIGGADGPEPTRYGDWEKKGITSDF